MRSLRGLGRRRPSNGGPARPPRRRSVGRQEGRGHRRGAPPTSWQAVRRRRRRHVRRPVHVPTANSSPPPPLSRLPPAAARESRTNGRTPVDGKGPCTTKKGDDRGPARPHRTSPHKTSCQRWVDVPCSPLLVHLTLRAGNALSLSAHLPLPTPRTRPCTKSPTHPKVHDIPIQSNIDI